MWHIQNTESAQVIMDLQHCPQRNVQSISKDKMFASTVSKYDPRTGRTTRLQNCVPYDQLITKDRSPCGFQRYVLPPPPNIVMRLSPNLDIGIFYWNASGSGTVDYGFGKEQFQGGEDGLCSREMNLSDAYFQIYSNTITSLSVQPEQGLASIDVSKAVTLQSMYVSSNNIATVVGLNKCKYINRVDVSNNLILQTAANTIATDLFNTGVTRGTLNIANQRTGGLNINTTAFSQLRTVRSWTIS